MTSTESPLEMLKVKAGGLVALVEMRTCCTICYISTPFNFEKSCQRCTLCMYSVCELLYCGKFTLGRSFCPCSKCILHFSNGQCNRL